ncbi:energy-coupling factor transporter transmembrane protein EcfT [Streptomyces sp. UNOC14_S4]|uniref:energy-coupling factor transporter transmembrane component T family protein n=1 Tax=Streptomyces sp. UNOC14_S4 TaxID=2872340 RepID=UPI001E52215B|nr:energy-coupling factor transporter transmembrane component T [Streptomyces sp. UNOC14_S4]MCC3768420.1 energy-coupling factor transporter transmembrane protein EcfT [Streptomyces sp. UNOC14_S4]
MLSLHREGRSPVHAVPAGVKLLVLFAAGTALFFVRSVAVLGGAMAGVALCYALARVPWRIAARQVLTVVPFAVALSAVQWLVGGWEAAVLVGQRMLVLVTLANLVTLTTRTSAMVAAIETVLRPLAPLGVRPERVGLLVAMTIRFIPVIKEQADQVRAAQRARGVERSTAFLAPLLVKTLRLADGLGEALDARGVDGTVTRPPEKTEQAGEAGKARRPREGRTL